MTSDKLQSANVQSEDRQHPFEGRTLAGQFQIFEHIGTGGMGSVYKAKHLTIGSTVAVKVLHQAIITPTTLARFQREAKALDALRHPNIVKILTMHIDSNECFIVMEHLDGISLSEEISRNGRLSLSRFQSIFGQAARALNYAHTNGFIHRDIKPSNIVLLKQDDGSELVKIVDFGIAKCLFAQDQKLTQTGAFIGSPAFMSPEQILGKGADQRADIYALGCVMFYAATGSPPFAAETPAEFAYQQLSMPVPAVTDAALTKIAGVVQKCTEKLPENRYASMEEVSEALDRGQPIVPSAKRAPAPVSRKKLFLPLAVLAVAALLILAATLYFTSRKNSAPRSAGANESILALLPEIPAGKGMEPGLQKRVDATILLETKRREHPTALMNIEAATAYAKSGTAEDLRKVDDYLNAALNTNKPYSIVPDLTLVMNQLQDAAEWQAMSVLTERAAETNRRAAATNSDRLNDTDLMRIYHGKFAARLGLFNESQKAYAEVIADDRLRPRRINDLWNQAMVRTAENYCRIGQRERSLKQLDDWKAAVDPRAGISLNATARECLLRGITDAQAGNLSASDYEFGQARQCAYSSVATGDASRVDSKEIMDEVDHWLTRDKKMPVDPNAFQIHTAPMRADS